MDEKSLIDKANTEREKLFQRYDHGREPGAEIDSWEDPGFEVYHQTDRYGFIHDKRLPQRTDSNEAKSNAIEMERVKKWLKMLKKWDSKETHEKLRKRVFKGIPDKLRSHVWVKLLNLEQTMSENKNVYQKMLQLARQWSTEARQIDSDVNRQFREHLFYRERYNIKQKSLFNVLVAYSMYNMEVGYCQGMSGLAGVLLMYMDEEEAFWALSTLLSDKKYAMHGLYIEGFPKLTRFLAHHDKIIAKFIPKLKKHFDQFNLDSILYSLKWFFVIFVERIPFSVCLRVWDVYLLDGERVVTGMAYTILKLHKNKILKLKDMDLIVQYLQVNMHKDFGYDDDYVIKVLEQSMDELRKAKLDIPPPAGENEFPKRQFGVFVEPTFEAKIGRRKSIFTDTEKEVTNNVILSREITAQAINESNLSNGANEDNVMQLNMVNNVPESEDGCSLLGSSRKSLADTSVTSTADLSIFSGGQRSQQAYDICVDDTQSVHSDGEGESSPGSAFCSLSVVGRTPSTMMITPTPSAMSPQDIVRIYVPPPPPDEKLYQTKPSSENLSKLSNKKSFAIDDKQINKRNSIANCDGANVSKNTIYKSEEELRLLNDLTGINASNISSSSRRGSMSRKSPSVFEKDTNDCSHIRSRKNSFSDNLSVRTPSTLSLNDPHRVKLSIGMVEIENRNDLKSGNKIVSSNISTKRMTSFEELAKSKINMIDRMTKSDNYENETFLYHDGHSSNYEKNNGSNIQYKTLSSSVGSEKEFTSNYISSKNNTENSPIEDYDNKSMKPMESINTGKYNTFFRNGKGDEEDETDDDDNYKTINKSSDDSSSSPNSKSALATPVNETIPLLSSPNENIHNIYQFSIEPTTLVSSPTKNRFLIKSPYEDSGPESLDSYMIQKNGSNNFDNRIATNLGASYEMHNTRIIPSSTISSSPSSSSYRNNIPQKINSKNDFEINKIRIKINHNQKEKDN